MRAYVFIILLVLGLMANIPEVACTKIKWTGNTANAPEAAKVPRSQKYWDENNIERPDYAKTDAEIRKEGKMNGNLTLEDDEGMGVRKVVLILGAFLGVWAYLFRKATGGSRLGTTSPQNKFTFGKPSLVDLEAKARLARLERFEGKKES